MTRIGAFFTQFTSCIIATLTVSRGRFATVPHDCKGVFVESILGTLLVAGCGLAGLLWYYGISPKAVLYRAGRRFFKPPEAPRQVERDAPYREIRAANALHRPILLNLQTSDGSGQACHPDVLYVPEGFGLKRWRYWMVCTPYPYGNSFFENPELFVSYDGLTWTVPDGLHNPLVPSPKNDGSHHSDPDILLHENELWLFYRETLRSSRPRKAPDANKIYVLKSADGIRWSAPVEVLSDQTGRQLLSPSVVHDGRCFAMWTIELDGGELKVVRRSSSNGLAWSAPEVANVVGLVQGRQPWHIDVLREQDRLSAILVSCAGLGGRCSRIHYAYSEDCGLTWFAGGFLLDQAYEFESKIQYRASLQKLDERQQQYELWYSAANLADMFSIAYLRLVRTENNMFPSAPQTLQDKALTPGE